MTRARPATTTTPEREPTVHVGGRPPTPGQFAREVIEVVASLPLFVIAPFVRPWHLRWGATRAEVDAPMAGDDLVPRAHFCATRALTIEAPPSAVWPWLMQVGFGRAGFYSNDLLDNAMHPSAESIVPEWQHVGVGDWVPLYGKINEETAFRVAEAVAPRTLLWSKPDSSWSWSLTETSDGATRLVTRVRTRYDWRRPGSALVSVAVLELGDFPMMRRMLLGIRRRAEAGTPRRPRHRWLAGAAVMVGGAAVLARWYNVRVMLRGIKHRAQLPPG